MFVVILMCSSSNNNNNGGTPRLLSIALMLTRMANLGRHYLSNATCLTRPRLFNACFVASRITIICQNVRHCWRTPALDEERWTSMSLLVCCMICMFLVFSVRQVVPPENHVMVVQAPCSPAQSSQVRVPRRRQGAIRSQCRAWLL